jgi:biotin---protein ligase
VDHFPHSRRIFRSFHATLSGEMASLVRKVVFYRFYDFYMSYSRDQVVTLTTTTPPQNVRIAGITSDYGLLRTVPERDGWGGGQDFIDLQPDGNSFDMMANMIKTKT